MIGWNLVIVNLARFPHHMWCWPWLAAWAVIVALHAVFVVLGIDRALLARVASLPTRVGMARSFR